MKPRPTRLRRSTRGARRGAFHVKHPDAPSAPLQPGARGAGRVPRQRSPHRLRRAPRRAWGVFHVKHPDALPAARRSPPALRLPPTQSQRAQQTRPTRPRARCPWAMRSRSGLSPTRCGHPTAATARQRPGRSWSKSQAGRAPSRRAPRRASATHASAPSTARPGQQPRPIPGLQRATVRRLPTQPGPERPTARRLGQAPAGRAAAAMPSPAPAPRARSRP
jgi:hypothetical protein